MKRINFERIEIFVDIDKTRCSVENYKKDFANIIYQLGRVAISKVLLKL